MFKKLIPYRTEISDDTFKKYEGFYFDGFVHVVIVCSFFSLIPLIASGLYFALIFPIGLSAMAYSNFYFTEIDFKNKRIKEGYYFLGKEYGSWKLLPKMKYLSIVQKRTVYDLIGEEGVEGTTSRYNFELVAFVSYKNRLVLFDFHKLEKALKAGRLIAKGLNEKLLDATEKPPLFLN